LVAHRWGFIPFAGSAHGLRNHEHMVSVHNTTTAAARTDPASALNLDQAQPYTGWHGSPAHNDERIASDAPSLANSLFAGRILQGVFGLAAPQMDEGEWSHIPYNLRNIPPSLLRYTPGHRVGRAEHRPSRLARVTQAHQMPLDQFLLHKCVTLVTWPRNAYVGDLVDELAQLPSVGQEILQEDLRRKAIMIHKDLFSQLPPVLRDGVAQFARAIEMALGPRAMRMLRLRHIQISAGNGNWHVGLAMPTDLAHAMVASNSRSAWAWPGAQQQAPERTSHLDSGDIPLRHVIGSCEGFGAVPTAAGHSTADYTLASRLDRIDWIAFISWSNAFIQQCTAHDLFNSPGEARTLRQIAARLSQRAQRFIESVGQDNLRLWETQQRLNKG
jgi:hypothetical protein